MKRLLLLLLTTLLFGTLLHANADNPVYQGQKVYLVKLKGSFKLDLQDFTTEHTAQEWRALFADNAKGFIEHYAERFPKASRYLHSAHFQKKAPLLLAFLTNYAKDSGNIPGCTCVI